MIDSLELMLNDVKPDIINLNETWLNERLPNDLIKLDGYDLIRLDRATNCRGGGLPPSLKLAMK